MADLVTLQQYKDELKVGGTHEDDVLERKLIEAEDMVLDYVSQRLGDTAEDWAETVASWREATGDIVVPTQVIAAILDLAVTLYRFRGDDTDTPKWMDEGRLPPMVRMKLDRLRDVTIA